MESFKSASRRSFDKNNTDSIDNDIDNININNIDIDKDIVKYDIPDFIPSNYLEELAVKAAETFNDRRNLKLYLKHAHRLGIPLFEKLFNDVKEYPQEKIKKSKGALFNYLCSKARKR